MQDEIVIVSGLPRSGTSLMMQMLERGGIEVMTDRVRVADDDNPRGYLELEAVKKLKQDASWLPAARGKAVKIISQLLVDLPASENYAVIWMERDLDEVLASQSKMLERLGRPGPDSHILRAGFRRHLEQVDAWLANQSNVRQIQASYANVIASPGIESDRVNKFLGGILDPAAMVAAVDPALYRNRSNG